VEFLLMRVVGPLKTLGQLEVPYDETVVPLEDESPDRSRILVVEA
jgi:hypothetical protein